MLRWRDHCSRQEGKHSVKEGHPIIEASKRQFFGQRHTNEA